MDRRNIPVKELFEDEQLSIRLAYWLKRAGCKTVADILELDGERMIKEYNISKKTAAELFDLMRALGFDTWVSFVCEAMLNLVWEKNS